GVGGVGVDGVGGGVGGERVVAGVADQRIVIGAAGGIDVAAAVENHRFDVGADGVVDRGVDDVVALVGVLDDDVAGVVDDVGVVAGTALHHIGAGTAIERVVAGVPGEEVGSAVAEAIDVFAAVQHQRFDVGCKRVIDRRMNGVVAFVRVLRHHVADIVDEIGVVAGAARHLID